MKFTITLRGVCTRAMMALLRRFPLIARQKFKMMFRKGYLLRWVADRVYDGGRAPLLPSDFDWLAYVELHSDLHHLNTESEAVNHYLTYGMKENRQYKRDYPFWLCRAGIPFADPKCRQDGLCLIGYLHSEIGLGQAARNLAYALDSQRFPLCLKNVHLPGRENEHEFKTKTNGLANRKANLMVFGLSAVESIESEIATDGYNIFYPFWELAKIPDCWLEKACKFDEIWVPSHFGAQAFPNDFSIPIRVVKLPVRRPDWLEQNEIAISTDDQVLRCFCFFDFDSYVARKNPQAAINAFQRAFPASRRDVRLTVKTRGHSDQGLRKWLAEKSRKDPRIKVIDRTLDRQQMDRLMRDSDVFISLHRSEGFGFGAADALAAGKAVVSTDYSATCDFITQETGYPIDYDLIPVKEGDYPGFAGQVWAEPRLNSAVNALQSIDADRGLARVKGQAGMRLIKTVYAPEIIGTQMATLLGAFKLTI